MRPRPNAGVVRCGDGIQQISPRRGSRAQLSVTPGRQRPCPPQRRSGSRPRIERCPQPLPAPPVPGEPATVHHSPARALSGECGGPGDIDEDHLRIPTACPGQTADQAEAYPSRGRIMHHHATAASRAGEQQREYPKVVDHMHQRAHQPVRHRGQVPGDPLPLGVGVEKSDAGQQRLQPAKHGGFAGARYAADDHEGRRRCPTSVRLRVRASVTATSSDHRSSVPHVPAHRHRARFGSRPNEAPLGGVRSGR